MNFRSSGTGTVMDNSIHEVQELKSGNGKGIKKFIGTNSGMGIGGFHSPEEKEMGICAHPGQQHVIVSSNPGLCTDR